MTCPCPRRRGGWTWSITSTSVSGRPRCDTGSRAIRTSYECPDRCLPRDDAAAVRSGARDPGEGRSWRTPPARDSADMRDLPFGDGSFDVVVSSLTIHNIFGAGERARELAEAAR